MAGQIFLSIKEANLLRTRLQNLLKLRMAYLHNPQPETIHDLRVSSRRAREVLGYMQTILPIKWQVRLSNLSRQITRSLGRLRETEVNLGILQEWREKEKIDSVVAELMIFKQQQEFDRLNQRAQKRIAKREFQEIVKFLDRLHGSRTMIPTDARELERRNQEFLAFSWNGVMDDERLHDLRIRTKKFRYSVEIYDRLHNRNLGRFTRKIRNLQEVLGQLHDLFVLGELIRIEREKWQSTNLSILPEAFAGAHEHAILEKSKFYPRVFPLYSRILEGSPLLQVGVPAEAAAV